MYFYLFGATHLLIPARRLVDKVAEVAEVSVFHATEDVVAVGCGARRAPPRHDAIVLVHSGEGHLQDEQRLQNDDQCVFRGKQEQNARIADYVIVEDTQHKCRICVAFRVAFVLALALAHKFGRK